MNLSVKDIAELLNVSDKTIYRMIQSETIPCFKVGGQWRFNKTEILSWIEDTRIYKNAIEPEPVADEESISIAEFLRRGGIHYTVPGEAKEAAILSCLERIRTSNPNFDTTKKLFASIMEREALCSTAIGQGIAIPHPASFGAFTDQSSIALCRLERPIPFGAVDNETVDTLFFIFPKSERRFLRIQAKLLRLLREQDVITAIKKSASVDEIYTTLAQREAAWGVAT
jgi:PTS system nitrogen regulatory IIA component